MPSLATSSTNVALPALAEDLGTSFAEAQWIILSYLLTITAVVVGALSRNLGLITGASALGAVFAMSVGATDIVSAGPQVIAGGMRSTFGVAAALILVALAVSLHRSTSSCGAKAMLAQ